METIMLIAVSLMRIHMIVMTYRLSRKKSFYIVTYYIKRVTASWADDTIYITLI